jgi:hypothetical protein
MRTRLQFRLVFAALAAVVLIAAAPRAAAAADDPQGPGQPPPGRSPIVVEQVYNGPLFGAEFKFTEINNRDAYLFGGYAGVLFDDKFFVGGAGYWQMHDSCYGYDDYYYDYSDCSYGDYNDWYQGLNGYGGLMLEWYALRSPVVSVSARGLIGGGVANIGWEDYYVPIPLPGPQPQHGGGYPPQGGYYYSTFDQGYFVFEPQVNVTLRLAPGFAVVGGAGYRVIGWANGWEDQLEGFTATVAIRFGGK